MSRYKPKGWRNESVRHGLASKGIKTKLDLIPTKFPSGNPIPGELQEKIRKETELISLDKDDPYYYIRKHYPNKDFDKDGVTNRHDCKPLDPYKQGKIHDFFEQLIRTKKRQFPEQKRELDKAHKQIKKIKTVEGVNKWVQNHKKVLQLTGLTILTILIAEASGGAGVLVQRISTGEIMAVGGSVIGRGLQPLVALGGSVSGGEGLRQEIEIGIEETTKRLKNI